MKFAVPVALVVVATGALWMPSGPPEVRAVHPGTNFVASNHLRFYVDFDRPMRGGDAFEHVLLREESGEVIDEAFRDIELWSRDRTRLMVYIHPGRIKKGLAFRDALGPVLVEGNRYTLEVTAGMTAEDGGRTTKTWSRLLQVGPEDHAKPTAEDLIVEGYRNRVVVHTGETLDHAGLETMVRIRGVKARAVVQDGLTLIPDRPLEPGTYEIVVDPNLEDLSGNSFSRLFQRPTGTKETMQEFGIRFRVR